MLKVREVALSGYTLDGSPLSEYAVDNVAADRGTGAEDGCVAHLLTELLAVLLEFARFPVGI